MPKLHLNHVVVAGLASLCLCCLSCRRSETQPSTNEPRPPAVPKPPAVKSPARPEPTPTPTPTPSRGRGAPPADPSATAWSFDRVSPTPLPPGFSIKSGSWAVALESKRGRNRVLVQTAASAGPTFNVVLIESPAAKRKEVDLTVRLRAVTGKVDQGGGVIWRARDAKNYYIARYNPLEDNLRLYTVKAGRRKLIKGVQLKINHAAWHTLRATMQGDQIKVYLDRREQLSVQDSTFSAAGQIGLWTKADAVTQFDDLKLEEATP
jgi:hypothetical protein